MEKWEANGLKIRDTYLNPGQEGHAQEAGLLPDTEQETVLAHLWQMVMELDGIVDHRFRKIMRHPGVLLARVRSDADRECLAADLEAVLHPQPKRGRRQDEKLREAACFALVIYRQWKVDNIVAGINDHGLGHQMKDRSRDYAVEILYRDPSDGTPPDREAIREMMDRPIHRRK